MTYRNAMLDRLSSLPNPASLRKACPVCRLVFRTGEQAVAWLGNTYLHPKCAVELACRLATKALEIDPTLEDALALGLPTPTQPARPSWLGTEFEEPNPPGHPAPITAIPVGPPVDPWEALGDMAVTVDIDWKGGSVEGSFEQYVIRMEGTSCPDCGKDLVLGTTEAAYLPTDPALPIEVLHRMCARLRHQQRIQQRESNQQTKMED